MTRDRQRRTPDAPERARFSSLIQTKPPPECLPQPNLPRNRGEFLLQRGLPLLISLPAFQGDRTLATEASGEWSSPGRDRDPDQAPSAAQSRTCQAAAL